MPSVSVRKKNIVSIISITLIFGVVATAISCAVKTDYTSFDRILDEAKSKDVFSGTVLVAREGKPVYLRSIGEADKEIKIPNEQHTKFQIGSITKLFTKILILQLAEKGQLKLSDLLGKYLNGFQPAIANKVTIQQLLDHSSGFGDYAEMDGWEKQYQQSIQLVSDIVKHIQNEPLRFIPGSRIAYSNSGYVILAAIVETITGKQFGEVLKEHIFSKVGMDMTGFNVYNREELGKAIGYLSKQLPMQKNVNMHIVGAGDGGIFASAGDMLMFINSLLDDNKLLSNEYKLRLFNAPIFAAHYDTWDDFLKKGKLFVGGGAPGVSAVVGFDMVQKTRMVVLSNYDEGSAEEVTQRLQAVINHRPIAPFQFTPAKFIYAMISEKGGKYFTDNFQEELKTAGIHLGDNDMPLLFVGRALIKEEKWDEALALYQVYTHDFPQIVVAWVDLGDIHTKLGHLSQAKQCYGKALQLRPGMADVKSKLQQLE